MGRSDQALSRRERLIAAVATFWLVAAAAAGVLIAANHPGRHRHHHSVVFTAAFLVITVLAVGAASWWSFRRGIRRPGLQRLRGFSLADRRATAKAVQKGRPLTDHQREIAHAAMEHLSGRTRRRTRWLMPLAAVAFGMNAIADTGGLRWFWTSLAIVEAVCSATWWWASTRLERKYQRALAGTAHH